MKANLVSYVNLKERKNGQSIYSSQLYGTFFMIYGFFKADYDDSKKEYTLESIDLKIMNYKGNVDLAITKAYLKPLRTEGFISDYSLRVEVQALINEEQANEKLFSVEGCEGIKIKPEKNTIIVERFLKPMHQTGNETDFPALKNGVFDEEFFFREGQEHFRRKSYIPRTIEKAKDIKPASALSGRSCPFSWLWFFR